MFDYRSIGNTPCPFCGSIHVAPIKEEEHFLLARISCQDCGLSLSFPLDKERNEQEVWEIIVLAWEHLGRSCYPSLEKLNMEKAYRQIVHNFMSNEKKEDVWVSPVHGYGIFTGDTVREDFIQRFQELGRRSNESD